MLPRTRAEATGYEFTSLHADVMEFLAALDTRGDRRLHLTSVGTSLQGRDLPLVVLSAHGAKSPAEARALGLPVVLWMCGIHPGEVEGKEAGLMLARDLLAGPDADLLAQATVVLLPLFNPDGNDAIDPGNRRLHLPGLRGQLGPDSGVGTRVTAAEINLNRDYLRASADEMRLWHARVWQAWQPDLTVDNHATNGSVHRFAMTYDVPHTVASGRPEPIAYMRERLLPAVCAAVKSRSGFDSGWYGNFVEDERCLDGKVDADPHAEATEGWMTYPHHPRFGSNYRGLCGRMDLLLEAYAYIPFAERVRAAYAWMLEVLRYVAEHGREVCNLVADCRTPPERVAVRYELRAWDQPIDILTRAPRSLDGAPTSVRLPHLGRFVGSRVVERPRAYAVPPRVAAALRLHGLAMESIETPVEVDVPIVESLGTTGGRAILEASAVGDMTVSWRHATRTPAAGWCRVDTAQPHGAVAVYLCEPESDDGPIENGLVEAVPVGHELPVWRMV
ncbi:MAG: M14 family metallopeptidase [Planctomycetota bacterium]